MKKVIALFSIATLVVAPAFAQYGYNQWGGGWGWGGSSSLQRDYCPNGDNTLSYYDGMCDQGVVAQEEPETNTNTNTNTSTTTTTGTNTVVVTSPTDDNVVITEEEENTIEEIKEQLQNAGNTGSSNSGSSNTGWAGGTGGFNLPTALPATGASI